MNLSNIKKEFPIFNNKNLVYLVSANSSQKPQSVIDRINDFYSNEFSNVGRSVHALSIAATNNYENTRVSVQKYINAKNKDEIVFELVEILMQEHNKQKKAELSKFTSTREKVKSFFSFFYVDADKELREIYKQFTAIALSSINEDILNFQTECYILYENWMESIIQEGIQNKELKPEAKDLIMGIFAFAQGMFIMSVTTNAIKNLQQKIDTQIDMLFDLIQKR